MQKKAIIFDIDGTLTVNSSWNFITKYLGASWEKHLDLLQQLKAGAITDTEAVQELCNMWVATGNATKGTFIEAFRAIPLRDGAVETIDILKTKYQLCLITGSMDLFAQTISERIGVEEYYYNTSLLWNEDETLKYVDYDKNQEEKKVEQLRDFCRKHQLKPEQCVPVGDSANDILLFKITGNGIFIKSQFEDNVLQEHSWRTIRNLSELENILD